MTPHEPADGGEPTTAGTLLGGRVNYRQLAHGHRTGIEPVLLAAAVPARPGEGVLEGGTGAGAALLCVAARVGRMTLVGLEADAALARVARSNLAGNGLVGATILETRLPILPGGLPPIAHALANPPWFGASDTASPDPRRRLARQRSDNLLLDWTRALASVLAEGGTLSLIVPAALHAQTGAALADAGCGGIALLPLWPRAGVAAKLVILQGRKGARTPGRVGPGLVLHEPNGCFSASAEAVLRHGAALAVGG